MHAPNSQAYVFANSDAIAEERLQLLAQLFDPLSRVCLDSTGLAAGWSCWEVGAGYGTIAQWLQERVGATGRVLATDLDPRFLSRLSSSTLQVKRHDIVSDPLPQETFDLIHARLLLCHLQERERVLDRMISALKPGGWLVIEDFDSLSMPPDPAINPAEQSLQATVAVRELLRRRGVSPRFGRLIHGLLRERGLRQVHAEGRVFMSNDAAFIRFQRLTIEQVQDELLAQGLLTREQLARDFAALEQGYTAVLPMMWSVAGRRA
jgi:SAM-dependent methyltransferase